jgi:thioredoxin 2
MTVECPSCGTTNRVEPAAKGVPVCGKCKENLPWLTEAGEADFKAVVEESPIPVLVDFWAPWCGPCRMVSPAVEQLGRDLRGRLKVVKVNTDDNPQLSGGKFQVRGIPTLVVLKNGKEVDRVTGALPAPQLRQWIFGALLAAAR